MEEGYVEINEVSTRIVTIGGWIDQPLQIDQLILVIPGNPGLIGYYETFMAALHDSLQGKAVVWGIGHGGHEQPSGVDLPCINKYPELFTLDGQIKHKISFIDKYVASGVKLHLIGHSIGGKISAELVKHYSSNYNINAYLLFPTLERMAQTPKGRKLGPFLGPLRKMVVFVASVINRLPESWITSVLQMFLSVNRNLAVSEGSATGDVILRTTRKLLHPQALERCMFMAHDELQVVGELNAGELRKFSDRLTLYFGTKDHWCPLDYCRNFQEQVPEARAIVCALELEHAFVLKSSQQMASIVSEWLHQKL